MSSKMITLPKPTISAVSRTLMGDSESRFTALCDALTEAGWSEGFDDLRSIVMPSAEDIAGLFKAGKPSAKRVKDPAAPKRAPTAYMLWLNDNRDSIKITLEKEGVELEGRSKVTEVAKRAGEMWKKMSEDDKAEYIEKASEASAAYKAAKAEYSPSEPVYAASKIDFTSLPEEDAPDGWFGPYSGKYLWKFSTAGRKLGVGRFNTFDEAVAAAEKLHSEGVEVGGITRDHTGYTIRRARDPCTSDKSSTWTSWVFGEEPAVASKPTEEVSKPKTKTKKSNLKVEKKSNLKVEKKSEPQSKAQSKAPKAKKEAPKKAKTSKKAKTVSIVVADHSPVIDVETETFGPPETEEKVVEETVEVVEETVEDEFKAPTDDEGEADEEDEDEVAVEAEEIEFEGATYWRTGDDEVYNENDELVGTWVDDAIEFN